MSSLIEGEWPEGVNESIAALLCRSGIPNVLWGDLANNLYGVDQIVLNCGFVVAANQLDLAANVVVEAGLRRCYCSDLAHRCHPGSGTALPTHFHVPGQIHCLIYICPPDLLWDILPLTDAHPNRLNLTVQRVASGGRFSEQPASRVLDASSTIKALTYLTVRATPERSGLALPWKLSLMGLVIVPHGRAFQPSDFGDSEIGSVLRQFWAALMSRRDHPALVRLDAQRKLDEIEHALSQSTDLPAD
ncbi:hypothetical protein AURDEDRAFT_182864 [Auricularia subglabra TFB-10046 SS5]|nr:hypothetical protein AURDEDRAFT_182864 [Auricularia subglabra TFB-10046 SS5]